MLEKSSDSPWQQLHVLWNIDRSNQLCRKVQNLVQKLGYIWIQTCKTSLIVNIGRYVFPRKIIYENEKKTLILWKFFIQRQQPSDRLWRKMIQHRLLDIIKIRTEWHWAVIWRHLACAEWLFTRTNEHLTLTWVIWIAADRALKHHSSWSSDTNTPTLTKQCLGHFHGFG